MTTIHWRDLLAHLYSLSATTCVAAVLTEPDVQWSIHILSLSFCFPRSIIQAHAEVILITITFPSCTNSSNENKTYSDDHLPKPKLSISVAPLIKWETVHHCLGHCSENQIRLRSLQVTKTKVRNWSPGTELQFKKTFRISEKLHFYKHTNVSHYPPGGG